MKMNREEMMKWIGEHMSFVRTTEEFDGTEGGIWVSAENGDTFEVTLDPSIYDEDDLEIRLEMYDYYSTDYEIYELGVLNEWRKALEDRGWYTEWYDAGTVWIFPLDEEDVEFGKAQLSGNKVNQ